MQHAECVNFRQPCPEPLQHLLNPVAGQRTDRLELLLEVATPYVLRDQVRGAVHFGDTIDLDDMGMIDLGQDARARQEPLQPPGVRFGQFGRPGTHTSVRIASGPGPRQVFRDQHRAIEALLVGKVGDRESVSSQLALDAVFVQQQHSRGEGFRGRNVGHYQLQATPNWVRASARPTNRLMGNSVPDDASDMESVVIPESSSTSAIFCEAKIH